MTRNQFENQPVKFGDTIVVEYRKANAHVEHQVYGANFEHGVYFIEHNETIPFLWVSEYISK